MNKEHMNITIKYCIFIILGAMTEDTLYARTSLLETSTLSDRRTQMYEFLENFYSLNYFITSWAFKV